MRRDSVRIAANLPLDLPAPAARSASRFSEASAMSYRNPVPLMLMCMRAAFGGILTDPTSVTERVMLTSERAASDVKVRALPRLGDIVPTLRWLNVAFDRAPRIGPWAEPVAQADEKGFVHWSKTLSGGAV